MALSGRLALMVLAMSILSYGLSGASFAQEVELPLSVESDSPIYTQGNTITISGKIKNLDENLRPDVTLIVVNPDGTIVGINQITPKSDGTYEISMVADGTLWTKSGDYEMRAQYGAQKITGTFEFTGGSGVVPPEPPVPEPEPPVPEPEPPVPEPEPPVPEPEPPVPEPEADPEPEPTCGPGTVLQNGVCVVETTDDPNEGGSCLIATAAYGSELAPQVQFLREVRDNTLLSTESGTSFMTGFNTLYYSFSPAVADLERKSPVFREAVKLFITPMLSTLSIMTLADEGSESSVLGLGISVIALNLGMYIAAPAIIGFKVKSHLKSRN